MLRRRHVEPSTEVEIVERPEPREVTLWEHAAARLDRGGLERVAAETGQTVEDLIVDAVNAHVAREVTRLDDRVKAGIADTVDGVAKAWRG